MDEVQRLRAFIEQHQAGGCKMLSLGHECTCPLCDLDRIIQRQQGETTKPVEGAAVNPPHYDDIATIIRITDLDMKIVELESLIVRHSGDLDPRINVVLDYCAKQRRILLGLSYQLVTKSRFTT